MIGAGGTGGHVYPALAAAEALKQLDPSHVLHFVGTRGGGGFEKALVEKSGMDFKSYSEVFAGPVAGVNPLRAASSLAKMAFGLGQSLHILRRIQPEVILFTGGWANVPLAFAARLLNVPTLIFLPDIEPGSTIRLLSRYARRVAVTTDESDDYFQQGQTIVTGYPLRQSVKSATRDTARAHFKLDADRLTLLVFGGSRGARSINIALGKILPDLLADGVQVIHITGTLDWDRVQLDSGDAMQHVDYHAYPFLDHDMGLAFAAADVVVCRSGASVLGELPYFGLPSILVPYPYAWRYQKTNAEYLEKQGAAIMLEDEKLEGELLPMIRSLMHDTDRRTQMQQAARSLSSGDGAFNLARAVLQVGEAG